jgi:hypothetical protein
VSNKHVSVKAAQAYTIQHAPSLKILSSTLVITEESSQDTYFLNDVGISEVESMSNRIISSHAYKIIGGNFTKN